MQQLQQQNIWATVPPGVNPGETIQISTPGGSAQVVVPPGIPPGGRFQAAVPMPVAVGVPMATAALLPAGQSHRGGVDAEEGVAARAPTVVIVRERSAKPFGLSLSGDVVTVAPGSLAAEAGFLSGDKLLTVDGRKMTSTDALMTYLGNVKAGQRVVFTRVVD